MNYDIFENKKIVVFLPHQDDEINIAYGLLEGLKDKNCLVKVVYSTNGDYVVKAKYRYKEAIDSLKLVGVSNENIIFMGYSDQATNNSTHLYHSNDAWVSNNGVKNTYSPLGNDYHYLHFGKHAEFNKENFIMDIYQILKEEQADFLICIDFDSHSDHRALSLSFEKALGQLMHENELYRPVVYKAFAYPTSYKGVSDFSVWNPSTKNNVEEFGLQPLENPYYSWSERVRFVQPKGARAFLLSKNIYFKGLLKHKSQYILNVYDKVINSDIVFFERKTNNLLFNASIETSSGDSSYLNDFMLFDCSDIMYGDSKLPLLDKGYTVFEKEDKKKSINVSFHKPSSFNCIKIYASLDEVKIDKIILLYNGKKEDVTPVFLNNTYIIKKEFDRIKDISLQFISSSLLMMIFAMIVF